MGRLVYIQRNPITGGIEQVKSFHSDSPVTIYEDSIRGILVPTNARRIITPAEKFSRKNNFVKRDAFKPLAETSNFKSK